MKECPNCKELIGDTAENCFNCHYNFRLGRIPDKVDQDKLKQINEHRIEKEQNFQMYHQQEVFKNEKIKDALIEEIQHISQNKSMNLLKNPYYEYKAVQLSDSKKGFLPGWTLQNTLTKYANEGWRLHTMSTNIVSSTAVGISKGGANLGVGSTTEITTLVFERCIRPAQY